MIFDTGNTKLEKLSTSTLRRAGLCEDHFPEESFTFTRGLKRDAVPIPFESHNINVSNESNILTPFCSHNINKDITQKRKCTEIEQVLHLQKAKKQVPDIEIENITSTFTFITIIKIYNR